MRCPPSASRDNITIIFPRNAEALAPLPILPGVSSSDVPEQLRAYVRASCLVVWLSRSRIRGGSLKQRSRG